MERVMMGWRAEMRVWVAWGTLARRRDAPTDDLIVWTHLPAAYLLLSYYESRRVDRCEGVATQELWVNT